MKKSIACLACAGFLALVGCTSTTQTTTTTETRQRTPSASMPPLDRSINTPMPVRGEP